MASSSSPSPSPNPNPNPTPFGRHALFRPPPNSNLPSSSPFIYPPQPQQPPPPPPPQQQQQQPFLYAPHSLQQQQQLYPAPQPQIGVPQEPYGYASNVHGAHLMALLGGAPSAPPAPSSGELSVLLGAPPLPHPQQQPVALVRAGSGKAQAKGRSLPVAEPRAVYDVDVRLPGEKNPPQLEVTPITKYVSDPGLVLGRQIAVNRTYICYGLKLGAIRVLNINTALRALLKGHGQRVSDMAFFAEDVHILASASVDGKIFVWKIDEGPDESDKPQITERVIIAVQIVVSQESVHPRVCWHCHKQEILVVGIGNTLLKIDTNKIGKGETFSAENLLKCNIEKLVDGIEYIGKHDGEVTDLSMCQWMTTRLVSASKDGTLKIWEDRKAEPLLTIRPHDGQPVNSVAFLTAPHRPEHIVLLTAGPLNREVKVWVSASNEGWLLPTDSESWYCTQTLDLQSSSEPRYEDSFFNQVVVLSQANLILLANAKKNAIYAVHVDYGPAPVSTRMDYIAEFTVTMPILSLTATFDCFPGGEQLVQVYCVQTHAIQQYALDLFQCLPPAIENVGLERDPLASQGLDVPNSDAFAVSEPSSGSFEGENLVMNSLSNPTITMSSPVATGVARNVSPVSIEAHYIGESDSTKMDTLLPSNSNMDSNNHHIPPHLVSASPEVPGRLPVSTAPSTSSEQVPLQDNRVSDEVYMDHTIEKKTEDAVMGMSNVSSVAVSSVTEASTLGPEDIDVVQNFNISNMVNVPHLITPSEILSGAIKSAEKVSTSLNPKDGDMAAVNDVDRGPSSSEHELNMTGEGSLKISMDVGEKLATVGPEPTAKLAMLSSTKTEIFNKESRSVDIGVNESIEKLPEIRGESHLEIEATTSDVSEIVMDSREGPQSPDIRGEKHSMKLRQASEPSPSYASPSNITDSSVYEVNGSIVPEALLSRFRSMEESINQILVMQKDMEKHFSAAVAVPITKEGKRIETSLGRNMEKAVKANADALWARLQEENAKREKLERDQMQQIKGIITNSMSKELPLTFEKALKKEYSSIGPAIVRGINPIIEKTISTAINDCFQRGIGEKPLTHLEKSVNSKLEATVARQIQAQFHTSGKQALQEALRSTLESSVIPAFEQSCKSMFEQVDTAFHKGMFEHATTVQKQFETTHTSLANTLNDALSSASSITRNLTGELAEVQQKLLTALTSGGQSSLNSNAMQQVHDPARGLPVQVEVPIDPKKELTRFVSENKFEEAFTLALQRSDVSIVSWLCSQVDLHGICSRTPLPLSQGVLLALIQQLACDIMKDTSKKLDWMREVATVIDPLDPKIAAHARPVFEQIYQLLVHHRSLPSISAADSSGIRLILHVIHSMLISCK